MFTEVGSTSAQHRIRPLVAAALLTLSLGITLGIGGTAIMHSGDAKAVALLPVPDGGGPGPGKVCYKDPGLGLVCKKI
jgi:hypothetical protein